MSTSVALLLPLPLAASPVRPLAGEGGTRPDGVRVVRGPATFIDVWSCVGRLREGRCIVGR